MASSQAPKPRQPPPSLFLGPPSRNSSQLSIPALPHPSRPGLLRPRTSLNPLPTQSDTPPLPPGTSPLGRITTTSTRQPSSQDRTDKLWSQMQRTLEEVELNASTGGRHVFGGQHAAALEALRDAQGRLAEAWGRGEGEEEGGFVGEDEDGEEGERLEEETESDIRWARRRREANDRYFSRVDGGVRDVVERLRDVAGAMRRVEKESREVWGDGDEGDDGVSTSG
ncbi:MAG: hypothetical protein M1814_002270 [Vezdaea aestivalis]|nr:MAG: hypothetical protein M1814_002270 [Vezdaea aestivalis]